MHVWLLFMSRGPRRPSSARFFCHRFARRGLRPSPWTRHPTSNWPISPIDEKRSILGKIVINDARQLIPSLRHVLLFTHAQLSKRARARELHSVLSSCCSLFPVGALSLLEQMSSNTRSTGRQPTRAPPTASEVRKMTVRALRYQLDTYHLDSTGRREVILKRLLQHLSSGAHPSPATGGNDSTAASSASAQRQPPDPSGSDDESASASDSSESEDPQLPDTESTPGSSESEHEQPSRTSAHRHRSRERRSRHFRKRRHRRKRQSSSVHQHPRHHSRRHHTSRRSRSSSSSSSSSTYRSRSRRRHSSSSSDSTSSDCRSHRRRRHHHYYTSSSDSSPSRHLSGVSCAPPVPRKLVHRIRRGKYVNFDKLLTPPDTPPFAIPTRHKKTTPPVQRTAPSYRPGFVVGGMESVFVHSPFIPAQYGPCIG